MAVTVGDDADAAAKPEAVRRHPFEGPPVGMNLHRGLEIGVMVDFDIRVTAADMREDDRILATFAERRIEVGNGVRVMFQLVALFKQRVRTAPKRASLIRVDDIPVTADRCVAGPFISREGGETSRLVPFGGDIVQMVPEPAFDLEIIALMAHRIKERLVAGEIHIILDPPNADGLAALAMQIGPVSGQLARGDHQRPGRSDGRAIDGQGE